MWRKCKCCSGEMVETGKVKGGQIELSPQEHDIPLRPLPQHLTAVIMCCVQEKTSVSEDWVMPLLRRDGTPYPCQPGHGSRNHRRACRFYGRSHLTCVSTELRH